VSRLDETVIDTVVDKFIVQNITKLRSSPLYKLIPKNGVGLPETGVNIHWCTLPKSDVFFLYARTRFFLSIYMVIWVPLF